MRIYYFFFFSEAERTRRASVLAFGLAMIFALLLFGLQTAKPAHAASTTFTVNSTGDENDLDFPGGSLDGTSDGRCDVDASTASNQCTLRAAIQQANKSSGANIIAFNIPSSDPNCDGTSHVCTISPDFALPVITRRVTINGYTQGDATADLADDATENTLSQQDKTDADLKIELLGEHAGLVLIGPGASNSVVRGLVIGSCSSCRPDIGIWLSGGTGYKVEGNFLGVAPDGSTNLRNEWGVLMNRVSGSTIGGTDASDGTVDGVVEARNLISANAIEGVSVSDGSSANTIEGNLIGTDKDGNPLGNSDSGVSISSGTGNRILSNSIFSNTKLGIDLSGGTETASGVTANDGKDSDTGANRLQNYPLITSAFTIPGGTTINGTLNSTPSTRLKKKTFIIQFFSSPEKDPSGFGEGKTFLGQTQVSTNRQGFASFSFAPFQEVTVGDFVSATATNKKTGDTSEFSQARVVVRPMIGS